MFEVEKDTSDFSQKKKFLFIKKGKKLHLGIIHMTRVWICIHNDYTLPGSKPNTNMIFTKQTRTK